MTISSFSSGSDLPPPPRKTGWPWTDIPAPLPDTIPDGSPWPRISIVTPSYNQGQFIEETIRSVLLQGYPNLEYIIIDGGSTDKSVDIIRKYEPWLTYWVSEPDHGQPHAINKGMSRITGSLFNWLNSDDILLPGTLQRLALAHHQQPKAILLASVENYNELYHYSSLIQPRNVSFATMVESWRSDMVWHQPGIYVPRTALEQTDPLDETLHYSFDRDWMCRLLQIAPVHYLPAVAVRFRLHETSKSIAQALPFLQDDLIVTKRYWPMLKNLDRPSAEAAFDLYTAAAYLRLHTWNRSLGLKYLSQAVKKDKQLLTQSKFWMQAMRAVQPIFMLKLIRALHHSLLRRRKLKLT